MKVSKAIFLCFVVCLLGVAMLAQTGNDSAVTQTNNGKATKSRSVNGIEEFTSTGTFTVPSGITHILVEMWGAGGGGGGAWRFPTQTYNQTAGAGGGGGAYTRAVVTVIPGETYNIVVGVGGSGGTSTYNPGQAPAGVAGGDSEVTDSSSIVIAHASGGGGGSPFEYNARTPGGTVGTADSGTNIVGRNGGDGSDGWPFCGYCDPAVTPVAGGSAPVGSISTNGAGKGGAGGWQNYLISKADGANGSDGYVLLTW